MLIEAKKVNPKLSNFCEKYPLTSIPNADVPLSRREISLFLDGTLVTRLINPAIAPPPYESVSKLIVKFIIFVEIKI